jgi:hypothetical protein
MPDFPVPDVPPERPSRLLHPPTGILTLVAVVILAEIVAHSGAMTVTLGPAGITIAAAPHDPAGADEPVDTDLAP